MAQKLTILNYCRKLPRSTEQVAKKFGICNLSARNILLDFFDLGNLRRVGNKWILIQPNDVWVIKGNDND